MSDPKPTRSQGDLAELLETLLDKGMVINADIAVTVGDTELLGIKIRAALASFETAAEYGLEFPSGTDMDRVHDQAGISTHPGDQATRSPTEQDQESTGEEVPIDEETQTGETTSEPATTTTENDQDVMNAMESPDE